MRLLLGGYAADMGGDATGIGVVHAGAADDMLAGGQLAWRGDAVRTDASVSWVTRHPTLDVIYGTLEGRGEVQAFRRDDEQSYAPFGSPVAAGEAVCHVAVAPHGGSLLASCWGDGRVVRISLDAAGRPTGDPVPAAAATDPYPASAGSAPAEVVPVPEETDLAAAARALRDAAGDEYAHLVPGYDQGVGRGAFDAGAFDAIPFGGGAVVLGAAVGAGPESRPEPAPRVSRAHQARYLPGGWIATTDLGFDLVRFWRDDARGLRAVQQVVLPAGSGPRHTVWHPSGHLYVLTEYSCEVFVLAPGRDGVWRVVSGAAAAPGMLAGDAAAELALSRDGEVVYAGLRGSDTIATLRVAGGGERVTPTALVESGTVWPRHHLVLRDTLLVAGQHAGEVVSLGLDARTGIPGRVRHRVTAPSPTCLVALTD